MAAKRKESTNAHDSHPMLIEGENEWFHAGQSKPAIDPKKSRQIIDDLVKQFVDRTKKNIATFKLARDLAEQPHMPRWESLQDLFTDITDDLHLESVVGQRIKKVTGLEYCVVNDNGEEDKEATHILRKKWFKNLLTLFCQAKFYHYSLAQFGNRSIDRFGKPTFTSVKKVDRRYVVPQDRQCLLNLSDSQGVDLDSAPYNLWTIYIEDENSDFGLLAKIAPLLLIKRNVMVAWSQFTEIFGLPFRKATTTSRDQNERAQIEAMLKKMGKAAYGLFPEGTSLDLVESNRTDSYKVFDAFIDRINSEISKAVLGQTGTTDEKSFEGAAKIHDQTLDDIINDDVTDLEFWVNDEVFPFLILHGFPLQGLRFERDDTVEESMKDKSAKALQVSQMGWKPTKDWIENELGVEVEDAAPEPTTDPSTDKIRQDKNAFKKTDKEIKALYKK